jgi:hypothetical protein
MSEFMVSVLAVVAWAVLWGVSASLFTLLSLMASVLLERYMLLEERKTYPLWIISLWLSPAAAFVGSWVLAGLVLSERFYPAVRFGGLAAGMVYAVVAVSVVAMGKEKGSKWSEIVTLAGSLVVDAACCTMLLWFFAPIEGLMRAVGG